MHTLCYDKIVILTSNKREACRTFGQVQKVQNIKLPNDKMVKPLIKSTHTMSSQEGTMKFPNEEMVKPFIPLIRQAYVQSKHNTE